MAILNDTSVADLGTLTLRELTTRGQVLLVADEQVRSGHMQGAFRTHAKSKAFT